MKLQAVVKESIMEEIMIIINNNLIVIMLKSNHLRQLFHVLIHLF